MCFNVVTLQFLFCFPLSHLYLLSVLSLGDVIDPDPQIDLCRDRIAF